MDVTSTNPMQQMQMRKMNGGSGNQTGVRDIMQNLSAEDKDKMIGQLSSMSKEERSEKVAQMKEVDASAMTRKDYTQALFDILEAKETVEIGTEGFSVYA